MARNVGGEKKGSDDGIYLIIAFIAIICLIVFLVWTKNRKGLIFLLYGIDYAQYWIVYILSYVIPGYGDDVNKWMYYIQNVLSGKYNVYSITFNEVLKTQADIGQRTFLFYTAVCGYLVYKVKKNMLGNGIRRRFSLVGSKSTTSFIQYQAQYWTEAKFAVGFNPEKCDKSLLPPEKPIPWLLKNKVNLSKDDGLDCDRLEDIFIKQVGNPYQSFNQCPFYIQAFLMLCMVTFQHGGEDGKINGFRRDLNNIFYDRKLKDSEIEAKIRELLDGFNKFDPKLVPAIENVIKGNFYYMRTACLGVIGWCGPFKNWGGGFGQIISPAMYQWLMKYDRTLFMALQSHGKYGICSYIEGSGVVSHFLLERTSTSAISSIYVTSAINGVKENLELHGITDFDEMQRSWERIDRRY